MLRLSWLKLFSKWIRLTHWLSQSDRLVATVYDSHGWTSWLCCTQVDGNGFLRCVRYCTLRASCNPWAWLVLDLANGMENRFIVASWRQRDSSCKTNRTTSYLPSKQSIEQESGGGISTTEQCCCAYKPRTMRYLIWFETLWFARVIVGSSRTSCLMVVCGHSCLNHGDFCRTSSSPEGTCTLSYTTINHAESARDLWAVK